MGFIRQPPSRSDGKHCNRAFAAWQQECTSHTRQNRKSRQQTWSYLCRRTLRPGRGNQPASCEGNVRIPATFAFALQNDRLARSHQDDLFVLRGFPDERVASLSGVHRPIVVGIVKGGDDPEKPLGGLEKDLI